MSDGPLAPGHATSEPGQLRQTSPPTGTAAPTRNSALREATLSCVRVTVGDAAVAVGVFNRKLIESTLCWHDGGRTMISGQGPPTAGRRKG